MKKVGIQNLSALIMFGLTLGQKGYEALEDGKLDFTEILDFIGEARKVPEVKVAIERAPEELADLDMEEQAEIYRLVQEKFDLPNDKVEQAIEIGLRVVLSFVSGAVEVKQLFSKAA